MHYHLPTLVYQFCFLAITLILWYLFPDKATGPYFLLLIDRGSPVGSKVILYRDLDETHGFFWASGVLVLLWDPGSEAGESYSPRLPYQLMRLSE